VTPQVGRYTITGELGSGAAGRVFLARDQELDRLVALKQLSPELAAHPGFVDLFRHEAEVMARLDHPNCVKVYDFLEVGPALYIVNEYVEGASLRRVLEGAGKLEPEQALGVTGGALRGLAHAHSMGLVHRDVKPENLLADSAGISRLADFGQAFFTGEVTGGARQSTGSPAYMSPEQVRGDQGDVRSDVYAAGVLVYEFMAGRPPFIAISRLAVMKMHLEREPPELSRVNPRIPAHVSATVGQALNKEPQDRYESAGQFLAALEEVAQQTYGRDWMLSASIAGLVTEAMTATAAAAGASSAGAAAPPVVGSARVATAEAPAPAAAAAPVAQGPTVDEPGPEMPAAEAPALAEPVVQGVAERPPAAGRGVLAGIVAAVIGLLLGAAVGYLNPQPAGAPGPVPSPSPVAGQAVSSVSAHFDEATSTTFYSLNGSMAGATYTWGWIKNPGCGSLKADPGGLTAGYSHNSCNQVLEAGGRVGVCAATPDGSVLYERNARFGDGALSARDAADAGISGDQFSQVDSSAATDFCATRFTTALAASVTPLPAASPPATQPGPGATPASGPTEGESGQLPALVAEAVVGLLLAAIGIRVLRRRGAG
jgi:hypothetical protein